MPEGARGGRKGAAGPRGGKWRGRPGQEAPGLAHSPSATRPAAPPLREAGAQADDLTPWTARRVSTGRREHARVHPARPRPSRVLAELVADATP